MRVALVTSSYNYIADGARRWTLNPSRGAISIRPGRRGSGGDGRWPGLRGSSSTEGEIAGGAFSASLPFSVGIPAGVLDFHAGLAKCGWAAFESRTSCISPSPDLLGHQALALRPGARGRPAVASHHTRYEAYLKAYGLEVPGGFRRYATCKALFLRGVRRGSMRPRHPWPSDPAAEGSRRQHPPAGAAGSTPNGSTPPGAAPTSGLELRGSPQAAPAIAFGRSAGAGKSASDTLVEAMAAVKRAGVAHRALVVGEGPVRARRERGLPDAVFNVASPPERTRTWPPPTPSSDIFPFPSRHRVGLAASPSGSDGQRLCRDGMRRRHRQPLPGGGGGDQASWPRLCDVAGLRRAPGGAPAGDASVRLTMGPGGQGAQPGIFLGRHHGRLAGAI